MGMFDNGFSRFLLSGFGTGTTAGKALGIVIFICLIGFIILWKLIVLIIGLIRKSRTGGAPDFGEGPYVVILDTVGPSPDVLFNELCRIKDYTPSLARKMMDNTPSSIVFGCDRQTAEDFVTVYESTGAKLHFTKK